MIARWVVVLALLGVPAAAGAQSFIFSRYATATSFSLYGGYGPGVGWMVRAALRLAVAGDRPTLSEHHDRSVRAARRSRRETVLLQSPDHRGATRRGCGGGRHRAVLFSGGHRPRIRSGAGAAGAYPARHRHARPDRRAPADARRDASVILRCVLGGRSWRAAIAASRCCSTYS